MKLRGYFFFLILSNLTSKHFTLVTIASFLAFCDILYGRLYYWLKILSASNFGWKILSFFQPWFTVGRVHFPAPLYFGLGHGLALANDTWIELTIGQFQRETLLFALLHSSPQPYKENAQGSLFSINLSPEWETHGIDMNTIHNLDLRCQSQLTKP